MKKHGGLLASFIGLDGSGKTTSAINLCKELRTRGLDCLYIHYSYPLITLARSIVSGRIRKYASLVQSSVTVTVETSVRRNDLRMKTLVGVLASFADTIVGHIMLSCLPHRSVTVYDRYFYDHVTNFFWRMPQWLLKLYLSIVPKPDIIFFLDVSEDIAFLRKKESSLGFLRRQRKSYQKLERELNIENFVTIDANADLRQVNSLVIDHVVGVLNDCK